jgi:methionyl-tRNA formyltransferase
MDVWKAPPKVVFMGLRGSFSRIALAYLMAEGLAIQAVVVPAAPVEEAAVPVRRLVPPPTPSQVPLLTRFVAPDIVHLAWEHGIAVLEVARLGAPETLATLAAYDPDVICVACFNQRFPTALLGLPRHGCLNLHPSLLPAYRGPAPLFWVFRNGEQETGVTVHLMDAGLDTGDILLQKRVAIPEGVPGPVLEEQCATVGARLMAQAVWRLYAGTAVLRKQSEEGSSYYPWPSAEDFRIPVTRPARWAFNFMRGVAHWGVPFTIEVPGQHLLAREALSYTPSGELGRPFVQKGAELWVQCSPGVLHVRG